ncbi:MAG: glycosyltransferase [Curtobacterium sp.]
MTRTTLTRVLRPVVETSLVPTWDGAVWIGELDRAELHGAGHRDAIGLAGADGYGRARLLVRDRGEPVGFVEAEVTDRRRIGPSIELRTLERAVRHMPTPERRPAADQALPSVTVVLCTDGDAGDTMRSVLAQRGVALDVVVVSTGADGDGRTEIAGRTVTTVPAPTGGLAAARNAGLLAATGDVVAFLGSGAVVDADWASAIATPFVLDDDVACVTGLVPTAEIRTPAQRWHDEHTPAARTIRRRVFRLGDEPGDTPLHPFAAAAYGTGANLAVRRRAALAIGGFDTAFGPGTRVGGGDDLDLFTRLLFAGSAIAVEPAAIAWLRPADDTSSLRRTAAAHGHGLGAWMTKNALDRDTAAATVDTVPEAIAAFARLGLEQGDAVTELGGGTGRRAVGRSAAARAAAGDGAGAASGVAVADRAAGGVSPVPGTGAGAPPAAAVGAPSPALAGVEAAWTDTSRRLRRVERRSVLVAPFLALAERLGGAGTIDRTRHGRHELATVAPAPVHPGVMGPAARLTAAGLVVVTLLAAAVGAAFDIPVLRGSAVGVLLFAVVGVAPMLLLRPMPLARFALFAVTTSIVGTIAIGYTMATAGLWAPVVPFAAVVVLTAVAVAAAVPRDLRELHRQRLERAAAGRRRTWTTTGTVTTASIVGLLVVVVSAVTHIGDPVPDGLFGSLGIGLPIGLAIVVAAAVVALVRGRGVALPVVVLGGVVQLAQAITYGMPTVMAAARHVGVLEYIRQFGRTDPSADIFQTWSGLFAGGAWVADVGGIVNAMTIAAWVPVLLAFATTIGVGVLAAHWLPGARRPWIAAFLTAMTGSLNTTYFSPQSTGILLSVAILVLATGALRRVTVTGEDGEPHDGPAAAAGRALAPARDRCDQHRARGDAPDLAVPDRRGHRRAGRVPHAAPVVGLARRARARRGVRAAQRQHPRQVPVARRGRAGAHQRPAAVARHDGAAQAARDAARVRRARGRPRGARPGGDHHGAAPPRPRPLGPAAGRRQPDLAARRDELRPGGHLPRRPVRDAVDRRPRRRTPGARWAPRPGRSTRGPRRTPCGSSPRRCSSPGWWRWGRSGRRRSTGTASRRAASRRPRSTTTRPRRRARSCCSPVRRTPSRATPVPGTSTSARSPGRPSGPTRRARATTPPRTCRTSRGSS